MGNYTWNDNLILPYESYFSIRANFCLLNAKSWYWFNVRGKKNINEELLIRVKSRSDLGLVNNNKLKVNDSRIKICSKCIKQGYHSYLHNSEVFEQCFIHPNEKLILINDKDMCKDGSGIVKNLTIKIENMLNFRIRIVDFLKKIDLKTKTNNLFCISNTKSYNSTLECISTYYFGGFSNRTSHYKIIKRINENDIFEDNIRIYKEIITALNNDIENREGHEYYKLLDYNMKDIIKREDKNHYLQFNGYSSMYYIQAFISNIIWSTFNTWEEYNRIGLTLKHYIINKFERKVVDYNKIATFITIAILLNNSDCDAYYKLAGKLRYNKWGIPGKSELLSKLDKVINEMKLSDIYLENGSLFIYEAVISSWFQYVKNDLIMKIKNRIFDYQKQNLFNINNDMYDEPEYIILKQNSEWLIKLCYYK